MGDPKITEGQGGGSVSKPAREDPIPREGIGHGFSFPLITIPKDQYFTIEDRDPRFDRKISVGFSVFSSPQGIVPKYLKENLPEILAEDEFIDGIPFKGGESIELNDQGAVIRGTLAQDFENLPADSEIHLNEFGDIIKVHLARPCVIEDRWFAAGMVVFFDENGAAVDRNVEGDL